MTLPAAGGLVVLVLVAEGGTLNVGLGEKNDRQAKINKERKQPRVLSGLGRLLTSCVK